MYICMSFVFLPNAHVSIHFATDTVSHSLITNLFEDSVWLLAECKRTISVCMCSASSFWFEACAYACTFAHKKETHLFISALVTSKIKFIASHSARHSILLLSFIILFETLFFSVVINLLYLRWSYSHCVLPTSGSHSNQYSMHPNASKDRNETVDRCLISYTQIVHF